MLEFAETPGRLEVCSPMRTGSRAVFALLALFPLAAPYELLLGVRWKSMLHPFFLLAAFISVGAMALSGFLLFTALAGLSSRMVFDLARGTFTYSATAPAVRVPASVHSISAIRSIEIGSREWSDGAPTYRVRVVLADGIVFETASSWSRAEVERARERIEGFLNGDEGPPPLS